MQLIATFTIAISKEIYCTCSGLCEKEEQQNTVGFDLCSIISVFPALSRQPRLEMQ